MSSVQNWQYDDKQLILFNVLKTCSQICFSNAAVPVTSCINVKHRNYLIPAASKYNINGKNVNCNNTERFDEKSFYHLYFPLLECNSLLLPIMTPNLKYCLLKLLTTHYNEVVFHFMCMDSRTRDIAVSANASLLLNGII